VPAARQAYRKYGPLARFGHIPAHHACELAVEYECEARWPSLHAAKPRATR
jgi:hypothetical protein